MNDYRWCIVVGSLIDGIAYTIGPFETQGDAEDYGEELECAGGIQGDWHMQPMNDPLSPQQLQDLRDSIERERLSETR